MKRDFDLLFRIVGLGEKRNEKTETLKHNPHLCIPRRSQQQNKTKQKVESQQNIPPRSNKQKPVEAADKPKKEREKSFRSFGIFCFAFETRDERQETSGERRVGEASLCTKERKKDKRTDLWDEYCRRGTRSEWESHTVVTSSELAETET